MSTIQGFPVIDEDSADNVAFSRGGYLPRDYAAYPRGGLKCARGVSGSRYPRSSYKAIIEKKTANKTWVRDKLDQAGLPVKSQGDSNYCWAHAPVRGVEACLVRQGGHVEPMSAFFPAAQIKNGRNYGGSGIEAVEWIAENGVCCERLHKPGDFSTRVSADVFADAKLHQILVFEDMDPGDDDAIIAKLIDDKPVTVGIPAWGHEVLITFLVWENDGVLFGFDNSWGADWGNDGRGILRGRMSKFDEAGSIEVMEAS